MNDRGDFWLSIRMRANERGHHLSGGERLVPLSDGGVVACELLKRGQASGRADEIVLTVEELRAERIRRIPVLPVKTLPPKDIETNRLHAGELLTHWGVSETAIQQAFEVLIQGASPARTNMRGAVLMDAATGKRLESDSYRGVRVSCVDMSPEARTTFETYFQGRFPVNRFREALILASKVASVESIVAELCWSDDPNYTTGYVASRREGYMRLSPMKPQGVTLGGRVFFVESFRFHPEEVISYLETEPVLVTIPGVDLFKEA
jgi:6-carboxyhexanoate--CoA ligase